MPVLANHGLLRCHDLAAGSLLQVEVVNTSRRGIEGATLSTTVFLVNRHGTHLIEAVSHCVPNVAANSVTVTAQCSNQAGSEGVTFVFLWLRAASGELISRNVYWLPDRQVRAVVFLVHAVGRPPKHHHVSRMICYYYGHGLSLTVVPQ